MAFVPKNVSFRRGPREEERKVVFFVTFGLFYGVSQWLSSVSVL